MHLDFDVGIKEVLCALEETFRVRGCTGEFGKKEISMKYIFSELNVVDMV